MKINTRAALFGWENVFTKHSPGAIMINEAFGLGRGKVLLPSNKKTKLKLFLGEGNPHDDRQQLQLITFILIRP